MKVDCHIHTSFSPDGFDSPRAFLDRAVENGFCHICITDHMDLMYSNPSAEGLTDLKKYYDKLRALKDEYRNKIYLSIGIECGWTKANESASNALLKTADIEYVINSIHEVNGSDCYYQSHFDAREKDEVYNQYFDACINSLDAPYYFSAIGHISYVARNAPYPDKLVRYQDYKDKFDILLKKIIDKDIIIELNTNVYSCSVETQPDFDVIKRYKELGGKHITFSSDAHRLARLGDNYERIAQKAIAHGFTHWTVVQNKELTYIKIK